MKKVAICLFLMFAVGTASAFDLGKTFKKVSNSLEQSIENKQLNPNMESPQKTKNSQPAQNRKSSQKKEPQQTNKKTNVKKETSTKVNKMRGVSIKKACLGGVCLGDSVGKLHKHTWIAGDKMKLEKENELPYSDGVIRPFDLSKDSMNSYYRAKDNHNPIIINSYLEKEKQFIQKYVLGLTDEEKTLLNPYYNSLFFDHSSLDILNKVIACKGKKLCGFSQTKHGNLDKISIMPSITTGKYEVVSIERQFTEMDQPQKDKIFKALKSKYPSIMTRSEARRAFDNEQWDESRAIIFWDEIYGTLIFTRVFNSNKFGTRMAFEANENIYNEDLLQNPCCDKALSPTLDID